MKGCFTLFFSLLTCAAKILTKSYLWWKFDEAGPSLSQDARVSEKKQEWHDDPKLNLHIFSIKKTRRLLSAYHTARLHSLPETNSLSTWKFVVGRLLSFWGPAYFQGLCYIVSGRVYNGLWPTNVKMLRSHEMQSWWNKCPGMSLWFEHLLLRCGLEWVASLTATKNLDLQRIFTIGKRRFSGTFWRRFSRVLPQEQLLISVTLGSQSLS